MHVLLAACHEQADTRVDCTLTLVPSSFCCSCKSPANDLHSSSISCMSMSGTACISKVQALPDCNLCARILKQAADCCSVLSQLTAQKIGWLFPRVRPAARLAASV